MAKNFKILLMIFTFGIYIVPKQVFYAQTTEMSCCSIKPEKKSCCNTEKHNEKPCEKKEKHDCNGHCNTCNTCHFSSVVFNVPKNLDEVEFQFVIKSKKEKFSYISPSFSDIFSKIWQPPKIG